MFAHPAIETLNLTDELNDLYDPLQAVAVAAVLGAYWWIVSTLQQSQLGQIQAVQIVLAVLMGGKTPPAYIDAGSRVTPRAIAP